MPRFLVRDFKYCGAFNGSDNYVDIGVLGNLGSQLGNGFSLSFWVLSSSKIAGTILGTRISSTNNYLLVKLNSQNGSNNAGFIQVQFSDTSGSHVLNGNAPISQVNDGQWHHIVVTMKMSTNTITVYIDGVAKTVSYTTQTTPASFANFTKNVFLGALNNNGFVATPYFTGLLDEVTIWNKVLSAIDVTNLYYLGATTTSPFAYYKFDEGTGSNIVDSSGNFSAGTWNGTLGLQWSSNVFMKARSLAT